jgi:hypothetical protein
MEEIIVERQSKLPLILRDIWNKGTKGGMIQNYAFTNIVFPSKQRERNLLLNFPIYSASLQNMQYFSVWKRVMGRKHYLWNIWYAEVLLFF